MLKIVAIVITGVTSGLGKAFFDQLVTKKLYIFGLSRRFLDYQLNLQENNEKIYLKKVDFSNLHEVVNISNNLIPKKIVEEINEIIFINNAATIEPIGKVGNLENNLIIQSINVNVTSPIIITNALLKLIKEKNILLKVLNISTGAAIKAIEGWAMYCATKAGSNMFFDVIREQNVKVFNIDPGVLNTKMQKYIRQSDFESKDYFIKLHQEGKLLDPVVIANNILERYLTK